MDPLSIGIAAFLALFALLILSVPIGFAMAICGVLGIGAIIGLSPALALFGTTVFETTVTYNLSIVPLFVLMGAIAARSGLSRELYDAFNAWLGAFRGGLALATVGACGAFAAICGSSVATAATMSRVALPEMERLGYAPSLATGSVAAGGIIGILIPPSVILVLYGILTETSIGDLFIAGMLPGVLTVVGFMLVIALMTWLRPGIGPAGERFTLHQKFAALGRTWAILMLFALVIGGIYFGVFTPTEAAGIGAVGAFGIAAMRGRLTRETVREALLETVKTSAMIFTVLIGALTLNNLAVFSGMAFALSNFVGGIDAAPWVIMAVILLIYLVLGCFLDTLAMILLTVPIFTPIVTGLGYDPVWFGIIVVMVAELGLITPPIGMNVFVIKGMAPHVKLTAIYAGVIPFVIAQMLLIVMVFALPDIALWLPETARAFR
ncbi:TRAP transporter large permease [Anianabacter salinae]|uniref:TRAP transporter large permease n=1 Tax=Anianabacter salinae TaxID=2851023 RepID=UPI00225DED0D|nr:TRAP transporter large permease [Anianabacter salinae]MBV0911684.1 TRAP transporter large permease [Anianabacter salinae]